MHCIATDSGVNRPAIDRADRIHARRARGWNTWDTRSVLRHVLLPDGLAISLGFAALDKLVWLDEAFFGRRELGRTEGTQLTALDRKLSVEARLEVRAGIRSYDGGYTELEVNLRGARFFVRTATDGNDWVALVEPLQPEPWPRALTVHVGLLWDRPGHAVKRGAQLIEARLPRRTVPVRTVGVPFDDPNLPSGGPRLMLHLDRLVGLCTGRARTLDEILHTIETAWEGLARRHRHYGPLQPAHEAMQAGLAWNLIHEPRHRRVLCPVARDWNCGRGGYAVFCWDSFLTAWMIGLDDPELATACLLETFREMVDDAFVANVVQGTGRRTLDRSQPPVGSLAALGLHRLHPDRETLAAAWPALLAWNRWWHTARRNRAGSLSWGSLPFAPRIGDPAEFIQPNTVAGAALESGLDNLPIYDDAPFDPASHLMLTEDVGLNSLYVADCECLAEIARILGYAAEAAELRRRGGRYRAAVRRLWWERKRTYRDRRVDTGAWRPRAAATCFYPLLAGAPIAAQAARLVAHELAPEKFGGTWMVPMVPRADPAFPEQLYQRGRIWPPVNFLIYLGLKRYDLAPARQQLVENSQELLLRNWRENRTVPENFSAIDGWGGIGPYTHPLYAWGGLMGFMALIEAGHAASPLEPVTS